ncbi:xin actin-binding repeat-containing protein 2-like isoform X2 [Stegodyphus dumicola]|uniref:xin actin-binding repeat-containing protein 2-like isoform X2 n=1 Tax=Stegodyphus dumicola TaxID=202533 RepID=UPI0015B2AC04|nr:xin actin-binding repeat-containing protein 2-like isoform X2 [Stegodyphus dumicola]
MSFQFKEDSPLTSPDSGPDIGEMSSPSQNADVVEFFDPFCPVKEESPTDYYPNVMLGQATLAEPPLDTLSEQQYSNVFPIYDDVHDDTVVNDSYQDDICEVMSEIRNEADDICEMSSEIRDEDVCEMSSEIRNEEEDVYEISSEIKQEEDNICEVSLVITDNDNEGANRSDAFEKSEELLADVYPSSDFPTVASSKSETSADVELITELEQTQSEEACVSSITEQEFDDNKHDTNSQHEQYPISDEDISRRGRTSSSSSHSSRSEKSEKKSVYKSSESSYKEDTKINTTSVKKEETKKTELHSKKGTVVQNEINGYSSHNGIDNLISVKNNMNLDHERRTSEKEKFSDHQTSVTDLMSTYVSLTAQESQPLSTKEIISTGIDIKSLKSTFIKAREEYKYKESENIETGISVKILKSSFTKTSDETQQSVLLEEVKPSVDRVKVQRTFSQSGQDELCLCKICGKHVYQMEKMKAEKSIFHKNCFRCKECNKLLNVDSYSSNEGDIYCKPHFRQLFQPKARFDGEDAAPRKQRRNEMIIRENTPAELPPDVVRSDSKPDHGLENIPVNLSSIKSKFEAYREEHHLPSTTDVCTLQRSASVMARLAKYQSAVSGGDNENGEISESDNDDECSEDPTIIKPSKHKEKVVFSGMSNLKSQWETGSVTATKEERIEEKKEELNKLRQRICLGRSESMKAVYEKACQDTSKATVTRPEPADLPREIKATQIKERFEKGELVSEVEEENLEKVRKEKEEDLSVFTEPGIANDAKKLFKQIDATVKTTTILSKSPSKSPLSERQTFFHSPTRDAHDVVKCSEPTEKEEIVVDTTDVTQRFKFFENYSESPKERKRFQITPPREPAKEDTPDREIPHDPNVVRAVDTVDDIPATDTARRMLDKFKALEKETPSVPAGPKPLKRITPPREYTKVDDSHDSSPEPERDPNIVRSSYKVDDDIIVEADKAKSLRAKFENWDTELRESKRNEEDEEEDFLPQVDTTKTLRAKFEAIKEETLKPVEKPKPKVNRFVQEQSVTNMDLCSICGKKVYPMEKMETSGMRLHKNCFRCAHCCCMLRLENYTKSGRRLYCTPHFKQLFISRGNYDEGFGREQHKEKWNRSCNNTPIPRDLRENDDVEYSNGDVQCLEQTV